MVISRKSYNKYDVYIFLLMASLVAGDLFGAFQIPRILAILFLIPCARCYPQCKFLISEMKNYALLFLLYSFLSCLWAPTDASESLLATGYNVVHMILFFEIIIFSRPAKNAINAIFAGFLVAFSISAVIAVWEIVSDNHLYTSKKTEAVTMNTGYEIYLRYFAAVTFYNFNMYSTFICFVIPFLFFGITNKRLKNNWRLFDVIVFLVSVALLLYNGSRGALVALSLMFIVFFLFSFISGRRNRVFFILFSFFLIFTLFYFRSVLFNTLILRSSAMNYEDEARFSIWTNAFMVVKEYFFIGCGAGGISTAMKAYAHGGITIPHNIFLEILSQYGLFFLCVFVVFLVKIFLHASKIKDFSRKLCVYQSLISFPFIGIINSGYLTAPSLWAFIASLYVFANYERIKSIHKGI